MEEIMNFSEQVNQMLMKKKEWYDTKQLPAILDKIRLISTCTKNLYDLLVSKSLIIPDPYRMDKKIADIVSPANTPFNDSEAAMVIGTRFSEYENMLDYICTYFRFSVDNLDIPNIKKLMEFLQSFQWADYSATSLKPNIRGLALLLSQAKVNASQITNSMISDSVEKCSQNATEALKDLSALGKFQREMYKGRLRSDMFNHPNFNKEVAFSSPDNEMVEIRKLFSLVMGKTPFSTELVNEIILEDQGPNAAQLRDQLLKNLQVTETVNHLAKSKSDHREMLLASIDVLGAVSNIYSSLNIKIKNNFSLMTKKPESFFEKLMAKIKRFLKIKSKEAEYLMPVTDPVTHQKTSRIFKATDILNELSVKLSLYLDLAKHGKKYTEIVGKSGKEIAAFLEGEISNCRKSFNTLSALELFFKSEIPEKQRSKAKGFKLELDTLKNSIISANAKKAEYQEIIEEETQLNKLGLSKE